MTDNIPFVSPETLDARLDYPSLIAALKHAFAADWTIPVRHHHHVPIAGEDDQVLLLMPAWESGKSVGIKIVTITPGNWRASWSSCSRACTSTTGPSRTPALYTMPLRSP
ncbi:MAG: hypothetical protein ABUL54_14260, partial [Dongia sp.]